MADRIAKIAVSAATYWIDRPYDYLIPLELEDKVCAGMRVFVPFSNGNRKSEGIVLAVTEHSSFSRLKPILAVIDEQPVLSAELIKLALFMRERFFCTVYEAAKAMLPAGLWINDDGKTRVQDKTVEMARLAVPAADALAAAEAKRRRSKQQAAMLEELCAFEALPSGELMRHLGASRASITALQKSGLVELYRREVFRQIGRAHV